MLAFIKMVMGEAGSGHERRWVRYSLRLDTYHASAAKILPLLALLALTALAAHAAANIGGSAAGADAAGRFETVQHVYPACQDQVWPYYSKDCLESINPGSRAVAKIHVITAAKASSAVEPTQASFEQAALEARWRD